MHSEMDLSNSNHPVTDFNDTYRAFTLAFLANPTELKLDESQ
jgi:hypothetical protein